MKKKFLFVLAFSVIAMVSLLNVNYLTDNKENTETLFSINKAQADFGEWWNRLDYNCIPSTCYLGLVYYEICTFAGEGLGSVPHCWNCVDC